MSFEFELKGNQSNPRPHSRLMSNHIISVFFFFLEFFFYVLVDKVTYTGSKGALLYHDLDLLYHDPISLPVLL